ncbi:MAG: S46 family peptidase [Pirellulaceae bacterium]
MRRLLFGLVLLGLTAVSSVSRADEGMWLFNNLPVEYLKSAYGFEPTPEWTEHLMKSSVRFNVGGSASFISSNGLVLTNHHVGSDTLFKLSDENNNYLEDGFYANSQADELKAPDLELNQMVDIVDVTSQVKSAVTEGMSVDEAVAARRAVIAGIEKDSLDTTGLRSDVVTLYGGGAYHLYRYKKYTDVRLVWAPESAIAFFGGDADNFEYPRYCLDACIFRVYEDGKPAVIEHFLKWADNPVGAEDLVFISGNPGRTNRIFTVDALKYQRDHRMPFVLNLLRRREITLQQFGLKGVEEARRAREDLFGVQNSRKAYLGMLGGLQDPAIMDAKIEAEKEFLEKVAADSQLAGVGDAFEEISKIQQQRVNLLGKNISLNSHLLGTAQTIVEMVEEDKKPSSERLPEYSDAGRESLEQQLFSEAPVYEDLEIALLADSLSMMIELRGADDPVVVKVMNGLRPADRAAELVNGTKLKDVSVRKALAKGGSETLASSDDAMIQLALTLDEDNRKYRKINDELAEAEKQLYAKIADATFKIQGTSTYPDATFTLRLAFGAVRGYDQGGETLPPWTQFGGAYEHEMAHKGQTDFVLPETWKNAKEKLKLDTPFDFVCTADIIGGNSGSPVVNRDGELVGLIFDGNIQSLTANYMFDDRQMRATSVSAKAIQEALRYVYEADRIVDELGK